MSLDKAVKHGKEKRKPYRKSQRFDSSCRPHGGCPYCYNSRMHKHRRAEPVIFIDDFAPLFEPGDDVDWDRFETSVFAFVFGDGDDYWQLVLSSRKE